MGAVTFILFPRDRRRPDTCGGVSDPLFCERDLALERGYMGDVSRDVEHEPFNVARRSRLYEGKTAAQKRLGVGISGSVNARGHRLDRAAVFQPRAYLSTSADRYVVPREADTADQAGMASRVPLFARIGTGVSNRTLDSIIRPPRSAR